MTEDQRSVAMLDRLQWQRAVSNYFFIAVNFAIAFGNTLLVRAARDEIRTPLQLALFGAMPGAICICAVFVCLYWLNEQREHLIRDEVRFRALMDKERIYTDRGQLSKEWDRIGDYPFRRTPVFFVKSGRALPVMFACLHLVPIYLLIWQYFTRFGSLDTSLP